MNLHVENGWSSGEGIPISFGEMKCHGRKLLCHKYYDLKETLKKWIVGVVISSL